MAIYIEGVQMPVGSEAILVMSDGTCIKCQAYEVALYGSEEISKPTIVAFTKPHGRLGDLDAIRDKLSADYEEAMNCDISYFTRKWIMDLYGSMQEMIKNADTIIPADGGEDK